MIKNITTVLAPYIIAGLTAATFVYTLDYLSIQLPPKIIGILCFLIGVIIQLIMLGVQGEINRLKQSLVTLASAGLGYGIGSLIILLCRSMPPNTFKTSLLIFIVSFGGAYILLRIMYKTIFSTR